MEYYSITLPDVIPVKLVTAKATYGIGFLTLIVGGFCSVFGIPNTMYTKKMNKAEALAMGNLRAAARSVGADGIMDIRCQIDGLSFLVSGTAYKLSAEDKSKQAAGQNESANSSNKLCNSLKKESSASSRQCPHCGEMTKTNPCEMCGKRILS